MSLNLNEIFNNPALVKKSGKRSKGRVSQPNVDLGHTSPQSPVIMTTRGRSRSPSLNSSRPKRQSSQGRKKASQMTGGFRRLIILNEIPVQYPDPPYDPEEDEIERREIEKAEKAYRAKKKLKLTGDPFEHRKSMILGTPMNLGLLPVNHEFGTLQ